MEADDERDTSGGTGLEKITAIYDCSDCHGTPPIYVVRTTVEDRVSDRLGLARLHGRGAMNGFANALIRAATADVAAHGIVDIGVGRVGLFGKQRDGGHDLSGLAVAALRNVSPDKSCPP